MNSYKIFRSGVRDQPFGRLRVHKARVMGQGAWGGQSFDKLRIRLRELLQSQAGFTIVELATVSVIVGITSIMAWSSFTTSDEKRVCKNIYSTMQMARLRSIATRNNAYVDFDMNGANVSDNFYTTYVDTDGDGLFGELNNGTDNEFDFSQAYLPDTSATFPGMDLSKEDSAFGGGRSSGTGVVFGLPTPNPALGVYPATWITSFTADGVDFGGDDRIMFTSTGVVSKAGAVYVRDSDYDSDPNKTRMCAVTVNKTGIVKLWKWDGTAWK